MEKAIEHLASAVEKLAGAMTPCQGQAAPAAPDSADQEKKPEKPSPAKKTVRVEDVRGVLKEVSEELGRKRAVALLGEFGVSKVTELDEADLPKVLKAAQKALKED